MSKKKAVEVELDPIEQLPQEVDVEFIHEVGALDNEPEVTYVTASFPEDAEPMNITMVADEGITLPENDVVTGETIELPMGTITPIVDAVEAKRIAYERDYELHHIDYDRAIESIQNELHDVSDERVLEEITAIKTLDIPANPKLIDVYLNELVRRKIDVADLEAYFNEVDYKAPWKRM